MNALNELKARAAEARRDAERVLGSLAGKLESDERVADLAFGIRRVLDATLADDGDHVTTRWRIARLSGELLDVSTAARNSEPVKPLDVAGIFAAPPGSRTLDDVESELLERLALSLKGDTTPDTTTPPEPKPADKANPSIFTGCRDERDARRRLAEARGESVPPEVTPAERRASIAGHLSDAEQADVDRRSLSEALRRAGIRGDVDFSGVTSEDEADERIRAAGYESPAEYRAALATKRSRRA